MRSRRTEKEAETMAQAAEETAQAEKTETRKPRARGSQVYCGPTVRGVAKQYTVYAGELPEELKTFIQKHPEAGALVVPVERFAETRRKLEQAGTAQAILYRKIKSIS